MINEQNAPLFILLFVMLVFLVLSMLLCILQFKISSFSRNKHFRFKEFLLPVLSLILTILTIISIVFSIMDTINPISEADIDISVKIESISKDLENASSQLSTIQQELENRIEYVEKLKIEAEIAENVISLTDEQVKAVQSKLNEELNANSEKSLIQDILLNSIFFVLGLVAPGFAKMLKNLYDKYTDKTHPTPRDTSIQEKVDQMEQLLTEIKNDMT